MAPSTRSRTLSERRLRVKLSDDVEFIDVTSAEFYNTTQGIRLLSKRQAKDKKSPETTPAAAIYHGENTFLFRNDSMFKAWTINNPHYAPLLRDIHVDVPRGGTMHDVVAGLEKCTGLQHVTIGVNEPAIIDDAAFSFRTSLPQFSLHAAGIDRQKNLLVLGQVGMYELRALRIPSVKFDSFIKYRYDSPPRSPSPRAGPISNGILESVVAREMMSKPKHDPLPSKRKLGDEYDEGMLQPLQRKRELDNDNGHDQHAKKHVRMNSGSKYRGHDTVPQPETEDNGVEQATSSASTQPFRFLDLPNEIRNSIYEHALIVDGAINPSKEKPSSVYRRPGPDADKPIPPPVLALLQVSKQVYQESVGIYYSSNEFVFYKLTQLLMFLMSISEHRKSFIRKVTLWLEAQDKNSISIADCAVTALRALPQLRQLALNVDELVRYKIEWGGGARLHNIQCEKSVRELVSSKGVEVQVKSTQMDRFFADGGWHSMRATRVDMLALRVSMVELEKRLTGEATEDP